MRFRKDRWFHRNPAPESTRPRSLVEGLFAWKSLDQRRNRRKPLVTTTIFVEGGGNHNRDTTVRCREGFAEYCKRVAPDRRLKVVVCGGRQQAFERFRTEVQRSQPGERCGLLVDSEGPVPSGTSPAHYLQTRDRWNFAHLPSESVFLMVQAMESWFLADRRALENYYGQGFRGKALPGDEGHIEIIPKDDLEQALVDATRDTRTKGRYHKTRHAFALLIEIDPSKVEAGSPHAAAFHKFLRSN
jgi:hypothetical protein